MTNRPSKRAIAKAASARAAAGLGPRRAGYIDLYRGQRKPTITAQSASLAAELIADRKALRLGIIRRAVVLSRICPAAWQAGAECICKESK